MQPVIVIPQDVLARTDVQKALTEHDFGKAFGLFRKWAGISLNRIAIACDISPSRVGELVKGCGSISTIAKIEQISDSLRIPGEMLRLARRPWEHEPENNGTLREATSQLPLLGGARGDAYAEAIRGTSRKLVALDNELHGLPIADMAVRAFRAVYRRLGEGDYEPRYEQDIRAAAAELAEIAGWALFDAEKHEATRRFNQEALFLARTSGDRAIELLILQNIGMQSGWLGRPREELAIAQSILDRERLSPRVKAIFKTREARGLFASGRESDGAKSFDDARNLLECGEKIGDPFWAWWITAEEIDGHQAGVLRRAGHYKAAIPLLLNNLHSPNHRRVGYHSIYSASLLACLLAEKSWRDAEELAASILPAVSGITSVRTLNRLRATCRGIEQISMVPENVRDVLHGIEEEIDSDPYAL